MKRPSFFLVALFGLLTACSQTVREPVRPPPPAEQPRTRLERRESEEPTLIAPPPQYGNKVVMAKAAAPIEARVE